MTGNPRIDLDRVLVQRRRHDEGKGELGGRHVVPAGRTVGGGEGVSADFDPLDRRGIEVLRIQNLEQGIERAVKVAAAGVGLDVTPGNRQAVGTCADVQ